MNLNRYEFAKTTADNLEKTLIEISDDPDALFVSAMNILIGYREAFKADGLDDPTKTLLEELMEDPEAAAKIIYRLIFNVRRAQLDELYKEIVEPHIRKA